MVGNRFARSLKLKLWHWAFKRGYAIRKSEQYCFPDQVELLKPHDVTTVFDVGANGGEVVAQYLELFPLAVVHAFEPVPSMIEQLKNRFANNSRCMIVPQAVSHSNGSATFQINSQVDTSSLLETDISKVPEAYRSIQSVREQITVATTSLDSYCDQYGVAKIDLLKLDIQGGELSALQGAKRLLEKQSIKLIYAEAFMLPFYSHQPLLGDIASYLAGYGYRLHNLYNLSFSGTTGRCTWMDTIFVSPELDAASRQLLVRNVHS